MSDILRDMYQGRIRPEEQSCPACQLYSEKLHELSVQQQELLQMLDEKEKAACMAVWEEMTAVGALEVEEAYVSGMRLGAKLMKELLKE